MTILYVTYPGDASTRFDRDYYVREHLPLVMASWGPHGLESCAAFWPDDADNGTIAICECRFRDEAAVREALASPATPGVMADVKRFTEATPTQRLTGQL
jgi:uncharacterized protein (TIGR02118 family)